MHLKKFVFIFMLMPCLPLAFVEGDNVTETDSRKRYGLSFNNGCGVYVKVFKCMTACKSFGYKIFRMDFACKCSCHEMKTSTILPFFRWRTNGTTRAAPKTQSPQLYHVVGTLSPVPEETTTTETTIDPCPHRFDYNVSASNTTANGTDGGEAGVTTGTDDGGSTVGGADVASTDAAEATEGDNKAPAAAPDSETPNTAAPEAEATNTAAPDSAALDAAAPGETTPA